jgi:hypothetical protein
MANSVIGRPATKCGAWLHLALPRGGSTAIRR